MSKKTVDVYVYASRDNMWGTAEALGLVGDAARNFSYTGYEVKLTVEYDDEGNTKIIAVDGRKVEG